MTPEEVAALFLGTGETFSLLPLGQGNINETYHLKLQSGEQRVLQRLRPEVFARPEQVMANLERLLHHLQQDTRTPYQQLQLHPSPDGRSWLLGQTGGCWRMFGYINKSRTLSSPENGDQAKEIGAALGWFHRMVARLDPNLLPPPLPGLHDTRGHLDAFDRALSTAKTPCAKRIEACCTYIKENRELACLLQEHADSGLLGKQVIHGDPKCANFLFDQGKRRVLCLIDLDTVGSGLLLHDIGDSLRSCCNPLGEEYNTPENISFNTELFSNWLDGYSSQVQLAPADRNMLVTAVWTISFELGVRFLTDYLNGNTYFAVRYPEHNFDRGCVQFTLCRDLLKKEAELNNLLAKNLIG